MYRIGIEVEVECPRCGAYFYVLSPRIYEEVECPKCGEVFEYLP